MSKYELDLKKYASLARQAVAEGCVLLRNEKQALPLTGGTRVAVFGRSMFNYYKSGLGSGGLVNVRYAVSILDALQAHPDLILDKELDQIYRDWILEHPVDEGGGWGKVPWAQEEMPVTEEMLAHAKAADASVIVIGRTAGEDQDNFDGPKSYQLTETEKELIAKVSKASDRVIVVLNVGNIIDMNWVEEYRPEAVLYTWQGGQEGGNGVADVLTGAVTPCGHLTDTIARSISDYPSAANFGDEKRNYYQEDVYVGYRYFETFAKDKVLYPFGFGLSYTDFSIQAALEAGDGNADSVTIRAQVTNTGSCPGKEVVQVYVKAPQGKLGNPARKLAGFAKTELLAPGASECVTITIPKYDYASYDDSGVTGHKSAYVLETGCYEFFVGNNVRSAESIGSYEQDFSVVEQLQEAYAPILPFTRMKAVEEADGSYTCVMEDVPLRTVDMRERQIANRPAEIPFTGDKGYKLVDVLDGKVSMEDFVAQLTDSDLVHLFRGEGMCSLRVTPGTAAAFGGCDDRLTAFGIPAGCCSDGPSGIRMDCGTKAFSMPSGTALGCTFNTPLVKALYEMEGRELRLNKIDSLLGPGMNIHRHPLNGRNFEYISEDPYVTGKNAAAQIAGMAAFGIGSTIKHFCGNNQEFCRQFSDSIISERALREIYLKGFEIAVKEGGARSVMTTYGSVNGKWTAGSYDLVTTILRGEWGFDGIVMTDWWARGSYGDEMGESTYRGAMAAAQNDLYMVCLDTNDETQDDLVSKLEEGYVTRAELQRNAKNILGFLLKSPAILHLTGRIDPEELKVMNAKGDNDFSPVDLVYYEANVDGDVIIDGSELHPKAGQADVFGIHLLHFGEYSVEVQVKTELGKLAQIPFSVYLDNKLKGQFSIQGTEGKEIPVKKEIGLIFGHTHFVKFYYAANGLTINKVIIHPEKVMELPY